MTITRYTGGRAIPDKLLGFGQELTPWFRYVGEKCVGGVWTADYGNNLAVVNPAPTYQQSATPLGAGDLSVLFSLSTCGFQDTGGSFGNIGTNDLIIWAVGKIGATAATRTIVNKRKATSNFNGWMFHVGSTHYLSFAIDDDTGPTSIDGTLRSALTTNAFHSMWVFVDRNEASNYGVSMFADGWHVGQGDISARNNSQCDTTENFKLGAGEGYGVPWESHMVRVTAWKGAGLLPGGAENLAIARSIAEYYERLWRGL